ncbi:MAG: hypothetical protein LBR24_01665 [Methanobrevibacter sp.]|nr:hypothetical protein [Methanobrevibacter sp.]
MEIEAKIEIDYTDEKNAEIAFNSLEVENKGFVRSSLDDNIVKYNINSKSLGSFLATIDDLIFSEITVEKVLNSSKTN